MPLPRIAIVGRPNVGKSSLLNMLAGEKISIVDDMPGVTRDRVAAVVHLENEHGNTKPVEFIDTGGYGAYTAEGARYDEVGADLATLTDDIEFQIAEAIGEADLILFAIDAQAGVTPQDEAIAKMLREQKLGNRGREGLGKDLIPVQVLATKVDGPKWEAYAYEISALGFGEPLMSGALNKYMRRTLIEKLYALTPDASEEDRRVALADLRIAIVGKRNAGKSTLLNELAGQERVIVSEIAGTTRDAVDVRFDFDGKSVVAIDTAGLRRRRSMQGRVEWFALERSKRAIERADVALLMIDATEPVGQIDQQVGALIQDAYKPCIIVVNKWDLVEGRKDKRGKPITPQSYETYLRDELKGLRDSPIAVMVAEDGTNVRATVELAFELYEQASRRVSTGVLNRLVRGILSTRGPSNKLGTQARVYFATQVSACPPTIVLVVNRPDLFTNQYRRFLLNRFREELPFEEVPIRLVIRARKPARDAALAERIDAEGPQGDGVEGEDPLPAGRTMDDILRDMPDDASAYFDDEPDDSASDQTGSDPTPDRV